MTKPVEPTEEQVVETAPEANYQDLYARALAEGENLRKRFEQEKAQFSKFALSGAVESLLPVVDNFYRATEHVPEEQKNSAWLTGIMHIQKQLLDTLSDWGVAEIPVKIGDQFDPSLHEAIGTVETDDVADDAIVSIQQRGYTLKDRIIRPAQVTTNLKNN